MSKQKLKIETYKSNAVGWCYKITNQTHEVLAEEAGYHTEVTAKVEAQNWIKEQSSQSTPEVVYNPEPHTKPISFPRVPANIRVEDPYFVPYSAHPVRKVKK
jgi:hypothetical protein